MSTILSSSSMMTQIWQSYVSKVDTDSDNKLSLDELMALDGSDQARSNIEDILEIYDQDGDGKLGSGEMPKSPIETTTMRNLLSTQEFADATQEVVDAKDQRLVRALYKDADVDGDGELSGKELNAEMILRQMEWLHSQEEDKDDENGFSSPFLSLLDMLDYDDGTLMDDPRVQSALRSAGEASLAWTMASLKGGNALFDLDMDDLDMGALLNFQNVQKTVTNWTANSETTSSLPFVGGGYISNMANLYDQVNNATLLQATSSRSYSDIA